MTVRNYDYIGDNEDVLVKAVQRAGDCLGLTRAQLQSVIRSDLTALQPNDSLPDDSAARALKLIRVYESLRVLVGHDCEATVHWMATHNHHFSSTPIDLIQERSGLRQIREYLEWLRDHAG